MLATRYEFAASAIQGGRVLEVACGTGIGLGYLKASGADEVVGCDIEPVNVATALDTYRGRAGIQVCVDDAQEMSRIAGTFDVIVCFEAIYYFHDLPRFLARCSALLAPGGRLILCSVNPKWSGFSESAYAAHYFSPQEVADHLRGAGFHASFFGAFPDSAGGLLARGVAAARKVAVRFGLIPRTMRGKVLLKRIFLGGTQPMPRELSIGSKSDAVLLQTVQAGDPLLYKVFYVDAKRS